MKNRLFFEITHQRLQKFFAEWLTSNNDTVRI